MAKQRYGINDGYRGAVGTVIGYQWRGKWCLRAKPRFVRNPRTERQQENRGLFAAASRMASRMGEALRVGLHEVSLEHHRTPCNHFLSINKECFSLEDGRLAVDFGRLAVSQGPVATVGFQQPTVAGAHVTVPFEKNPLHLRADSDDKVYLYAWCRELDEGLLSVPAYRRSRQVAIELPAHWTGCSVHLYGFVENFAGKASDSAYLGCLEGGATESPCGAPSVEDSASVAVFCKDTEGTPYPRVEGACDEGTPPALQIIRGRGTYI